MLGPVQNANITAYFVSQLDGSLETTTPIGTATTNADGSFHLTLTVAPTKPIGVRLSGGHYKEEATGITIPVGLHTFTTLIADPDTNQSVSVGPLPDVAYQRFTEVMKSGAPSLSELKLRIESVNRSVSLAFGISDVVAIIPANPYMNIPSTEEGTYTTLLAGLSSAAASRGLDSMTLAKAFGANYQSAGHFAQKIVSVKDAQGSTVTVSPPSFSQLSNIFDSLKSRSILLPGIQIPEDLSLPSLNSAPTPPLPPPTPYPNMTTSSRVQVIPKISDDTFLGSMSEDEFTAKVSVSGPSLAPITQEIKWVPGMDQLSVVVPRGPQRLVEIEIRKMNNTSGETRIFYGRTVVSFDKATHEIPITLSESP